MLMCVTAANATVNSMSGTIFLSLCGICTVSLLRCSLIGQGTPEVASWKGKGTEKGKHSPVLQIIESGGSNRSEGREGQWAVWALRRGL